MQGFYLPLLFVHRIDNEDRISRLSFPLNLVKCKVGSFLSLSITKLIPDGVFGIGCFFNISGIWHEFCYKCLSPKAERELERRG